MKDETAHRRRLEAFVIDASVDMATSEVLVATFIVWLAPMSRGRGAVGDEAQGLEGSEEVGEGGLGVVPRSCDCLGGVAANGAELALFLLGGQAGVNLGVGGLAGSLQVGVI